jgi:hypothetical protein
MAGSSKSAAMQSKASLRPGEDAGGGLRRRAANFWLDALFFCTRHAPWLVRGTRGFFLWWAWNTSQYLRQVTRINARRILGESSTPRQRDDLGKRVIGSFVCVGSLTAAPIWHEPNCAELWTPTR